MHLRVTIEWRAGRWLIYAVICCHQMKRVHKNEWNKRHERLVERKRNKRTISFTVDKSSHPIRVGDFLFACVSSFFFLTTRVFVHESIEDSTVAVTVDSGERESEMCDPVHWETKWLMRGWKRIEERTKERRELFHRSGSKTNREMKKKKKLNEREKGFRSWSFLNNLNCAYVCAKCVWRQVRGLSSCNRLVTVMNGCMSSPICVLLSPFPDLNQVTLLLSITKEKTERQGEQREVVYILQLHPKVSVNGCEGEKERKCDEEEEEEDERSSLLTSVLKRSRPSDHEIYIPRDTEETLGRLAHTQSV